MATSCSDVVAMLSGLLQVKGYQIHNGDAEAGATVDDESGEDWWFTWAADGMSDCKSGPTCASCLDAEASAIQHFFANACIEVHRVDIEVGEPASQASADAAALVEELTRALVGLYPWAKLYIERRRDPLHGPGEFARIDVARGAVERVLGSDEMVRRLGKRRGN